MLDKATREHFLPLIRQKLADDFNVLMLPKTVLVSRENVVVTITWNKKPGVFAFYADSRVVPLDDMIDKTNEESKQIVARFATWRMTYPQAPKIIQDIKNHHSKGQPK